MFKEIKDLADNSNKLKDFSIISKQLSNMFIKDGNEANVLNDLSITMEQLSIALDKFNQLKLKGK